MKIAVTSDIHLEFGDLDIVNDQGADVLVLAGDILIAADITQRDPYLTLGWEYRSNRYHDFMQRCAAQFPHVVYVLGNHEHYNGDFAKTEQHLRDVFGYLKNVYILERGIKTINDVTFIGGTLWSDMNNGDQLTFYHVRKMMNDFVCVKNSNREVWRTVPLYKENPSYTKDGKNGGKYETDKNGFYIQIGEKKKSDVATFSPEDAFEEHVKTKGYIQQIIEGKQDQKFVVVGHHAPSKQSIHPRYAHDTIMNGAYGSNLDEFIEDHPQIKLWVHGHTHEDFDYIIGGTRIVCNPRGYVNHEHRTDTWKPKIIEV